MVERPSNEDLDKELIRLRTELSEELHISPSILSPSFNVEKTLAKSKCGQRDVARMQSTSENVQSTSADVATSPKHVGDVGEHEPDVGEHESDVGKREFDVGQHESDVGEPQSDVGTTESDVGKQKDAREFDESEARSLSHGRYAADRSRGVSAT